MIHASCRRAASTTGWLDHSSTVTRSVSVNPFAFRRSLTARMISRASAFGPEVVVEGEVERDRVRAVLGEREVFVLLGADLDVGGLELHRLAVDVEGVRALFVERGADLAPVDVSEERLHARRELAEARTERAEVRCDAIRQQTLE